MQNRIVTSGMWARGRARSIKRCAASGRVAVVRAAHLEGGEAAERVQEVTQPPREASPLDLASPSPRGGDQPPRVRRPILPPGVVQEDVVPVRVCPHRQLSVGRVHVLYLMRGKDGRDERVWPAIDGRHMTALPICPGTDLGPA